jgi:hypothetical protein
MIETPNQPIETKKCSKKSMFNILKMKRSQKFVLGLLDKICKFDPKSKKIIETTNQNENFPKKKLFSTLKM